MRRYIDVDKMIEFANNTKDKTIDANDIARFPAADVRESVRGKWIFPFGDRKYKECSVCGKQFYSIPSNTKFCPNCGAQMSGGES